MKEMHSGTWIETNKNACSHLIIKAQKTTYKKWVRGISDLAFNVIKLYYALNVLKFISNIHKTVTRHLKDEEKNRIIYYLVRIIINYFRKKKMFYALIQVVMKKSV